MKIFLNEHFVYEVQMLISAHQLHNSAATLFQANQIEMTKYIWNKNIGIEGVLMHVRNLTEFFFDKPDKKEKYARALHYLPNWLSEIEKVKENNKELMPTINTIRDRTDDEIVHLGWERLNKTQLTRGWSLDQIALSFINLSLVFIDKIEKDGIYYGDGLNRLKYLIYSLYT